MRSAHSLSGALSAILEIELDPPAGDKWPPETLPERKSPSGPSARLSSEELVAAYRNMLLSGGGRQGSTAQAAKQDLLPDLGAGHEGFSRQPG